MSWWRHQMETFSALLALCAGNSPVPVNSPHKGQWRGASMFSLICTWIHDWVNNREAGDLRRHRGHYYVIVMGLSYQFPTWKLHFKITAAIPRGKVKRNIFHAADKVITKWYMVPIFFPKLLNMFVKLESTRPLGKAGDDLIHYDVIKWKHFPRYSPFVRGIHRSPVNSPHKDQWRGVLTFSLIFDSINSWVNNSEAGDLRRHRGHYYVIVMGLSYQSPTWKLYFNITAAIPRGKVKRNLFHAAHGPNRLFLNYSTCLGSWKAPGF